MLWVGAALDRIGLLTYAVIASALLAGACLLLALSGSTPLLVLALLGLRLAGQGMMSHASITGMARSFTPNRGKAIALATLGHPAGEALLPIVAVMAAAGLGWRNLWIGAAAVLMLALALMFGLLGRIGTVRPVAALAGKRRRWIVQPQGDAPRSPFLPDRAGADRPELHRHGAVLPSGPPDRGQGVGAVVVSPPVSPPMRPRQRRV
jgi:MFS family permease